MYECFADVSGCAFRRPEFPGTAVREGYGPPCRCWELNSGSLPEQSVPLTIEPLFGPKATTDNAGQTTYYYSDF